MTASTIPPGTSASSGPTGLLIFRAWVEAGARPSLRVRVTRLDDLEASESSSFVTASPEELEATLHDWLSRFQLP